jgi:hypothetical protein
MEEFQTATAFQAAGRGDQVGRNSRDGRQACADAIRMTPITASKVAD